MSRSVMSGGAASIGIDDRKRRKLLSMLHGFAEDRVATCFKRDRHNGGVVDAKLAHFACEVGWQGGQTQGSPSRVRNARFGARLVRPDRARPHQLTLSEAL